MTRLLAAALLLPALAAAAPLDCAPGTLQDYVDLGPQGCRLGNVLVFDFLALHADPALMVSPFGIGLEFHVNQSAGAGELLQNTIGYTVMALDPGQPLALVRLGMTGSSAVPDGVTTVVEEFCLGAAFSGGICAAGTDALIVYDIGIDALKNQTLLLGGLGTLGVMKDIVVDGGLTGAASISTATNQFAVVPEPATALCLLAGWLVVGLRRYSLRKSGGSL